MTEVYIGLGANLDDPPAKIREAVSLMNEHADLGIDACSSLYRSRPMGPQDQPDYANAVVRLRCELQPLALLKALQAIEKRIGREREGALRWGPRMIDLDLLLFGEQLVNHPELHVPHAGLAEREFVVFPLLELAPALCLPDGRKLSELAERLDRNGLEVWSGYSLCPKTLGR